MEINIERLEKKAIIQDLEILTLDIELMEELRNIVDHVSLKETNGLNVMDLVLNEIINTGLYEITKLKGFERNNQSGFFY